MSVNIIKKLVDRFFQSRDGNVSVFAAIVGTCLLLFIAVTIDVAKGHSATEKLQLASDQAVLQAVLNFEEVESKKDETTLKRSIRQYVKSHAAEIPDLAKNSIRVEVDTSQKGYAIVNTKAEIKTIFADLLGKKRYEIAVSSEATLGEGTAPVEMAFVFDSTTSMTHDTRWTDGMTALTQSLNSLRGDSTDDFYVTFIPFQDYVNIGTHRSVWASPPPSGWTGCVDPREEAMGGLTWSLDDDLYTVHNFQASPDDRVGVSTSSKPKTYDFGCPNVPITGPTNNVSTITSAMNMMSSGGSGRLDIGLAWAWRSLSVKWIGQWGVNNYPAKSSERRKVIVYLSDANTSAYKNSMDGDSSWGYGMGSLTGFSHLEDLCNRIKADNIEIYIIQLEGNNKATPYLQNCATSNEYYFYVKKNEPLAPAFANLAVETTEGKARLVR